MEGWQMYFTIPVFVFRLCLCLFALGLSLKSGYASQVIRDVPYCTGGGNQLTMDIYIPDEIKPRPLPVAMYIHGGGWATGSKDNGDWMQPVLDTLVARGYLAVSINYRLAPPSLFPAFLEDAKCAVRFLRANAAAYQIDPNRIGVWGHSAGGHIASMVGLTDASAGFEGTGGYANVSSRVQAVVDIAGPADLTVASEFLYPSSILDSFGVFPDPNSLLLQSASPVNYPTSEDPPFLIIHGDRDITVQPAQSQRLYDRMGAAGVTATLIIVSNADHSLQPVDPGDIVPSVNELVTLITGFFDQNVRGFIPPVARFSSSCIGLTCLLDGTASSGPNPIASYFWDLGKFPDGTTQGAVVTVTYPHESTRNVTLTVTDTVGLSARVTQQIVVGSTPPIARFSSSCIDLTCVLDGTASSGPNPIASYSWNLGFPGGTAQGGVVTVTYPGAGARNVTLTVTDTAGLSASITQQIVVGSTPLVAEFNFSCIELTCVLDGTASSGPNPIASYFWDLGKFPDGTTEGAVVTVTYPHESTRNVTLTVTDTAGLRASITQQIDVGSLMESNRARTKIAPRKRGSVR
jgi:acetyl esterase/lipase